MSDDSSHQPENDSSAPYYRVRLFIAGDEPNSAKAKAILSHLYETYLKDCCEIQIVDVYEDYQAAIDYQVVIVPTLIVESPSPVKTIVGTLSDEDKVLAALGLTNRKVR